MRDQSSLLFDFFDVELQLLSFKNVPVNSSGLTGSAGNTGEKTTSGELFLNLGFRKIPWGPSLWSSIFLQF